MLFLRFCLFCAVALTLAPLLGFIDARVAGLQAAAIHLAAATALLSVLMLLYRRRLWAIVGMLAALWNIALAWPSIAANVQAAFADAPPKAKTLKVVSFNLAYDNPDYSKTVAFLAKSGADVIGLSEVTPEAKKALGKLDEIYPHRVDCVGQDRFCELMLLSKKPLRYGFAGKIGAKLTYVASADLDFQGSAISVAVAHIVLPFVKPDWQPLQQWLTPDDPSPLLPKTPWLWQSMQMAVLADYAKSLGRDQIVMGDFNSVPWSDAQVAFRAATGLDNRGPLVATWPTRLPAPLRVPIDTVFVGGGLTLRNLHPGPDLGSDHLPLIAEIGAKSIIAEAE
ncbi:endonuclease/exonuclease/phosphatase family protein [Dongia sp.]|uniref:endonuclease/exonuclease/phosphatase family protein n=1 Tax=Dongia sp. TaxID=1977262 RepID=UPI00375251A9